jgi:hypothetical protein
MISIVSGSSFPVGWRLIFFWILHIYCKWIVSTSY